jgi:hypothetical protein
MGEFLFRQVLILAAFRELIPLGARTTVLQHLIIRPALIHDTGTAGKEPLCAKHLILELLDIFRQIEHNLAPGGSSSYAHSTDTNAKSWRLIPESVLVYCRLHVLVNQLVPKTKKVLASFQTTIQKACNVRWGQVGFETRTWGYQAKCVDNSACCQVKIHY